MSLLDHPEAKALLDDAEVSPDDVRGCRDHITRFLKRYLPLFYRQEQRGHAAAFVRGLLSGLERKSVEPIAAQAGIPRKNLQMFVGQGAWDDEAVTSEMRQHVAEELGDPEGIIVLDPSSFPKKGEDSCGVARQWCGRMGKTENCQLGVFLAYTSAKGHAPLDRRLYLPQEWVDDPARRQQCHVPEEVTYKKTWEIAHDLLTRSGPKVAHRWVVGDDEFGRASEFRAKLRRDGERYLLDVPCNTNVRDLETRRPARKRAHGGVKRERPWVRVDSWAKKLPADRWTSIDDPRWREGSAGSGGGDDAGVRQAFAADWPGGATAGDPHARPEAGLDVLAEQRAVGDSAGRVGACEVESAPGRGGVPAGQRRGGVGPLRGPELGGLASPYHAGISGVVVLDPGTRSDGGEKPRR